jgi:hypothetical protein
MRKSLGLGYEEGYCHGEGFGARAAKAFKRILAPKSLFVKYWILCEKKAIRTSCF